MSLPNTPTPEPRRESIADLIVIGLALLIFVTPVLLVVALATAPATYLGPAPLMNTFWAIIAAIVCLIGAASLLAGLHRLLRAAETKLLA